MISESTAKRKPGRPRKAEKYGGHIARAEDLIADRLPQLVENLLKLAAGVLVQETGKDGGTEIFSKPPDRAANEYLLNRILGRPTDQVEVSGPDGEPLSERVLIYLPSNGRTTTATPLEQLGDDGTAADNDNDAEAPAGTAGALPGDPG
ncbi:MAG: hypothetical protein AB7W06_17405 [Alphaproteobacteria bacterium]